jgi:hypothetical protein
MLNTFCDICIKAIEKGMRLNTHFDKAGWKYVMNCFKEHTWHALMKAQLKNKWDGIKKDWRIWKKLISKTRVGWSTKLGTILATGEWWKSKIKVCFLFLLCIITMNFFIFYSYNHYDSFISLVSLVVGDTRS